MTLWPRLGLYGEFAPCEEGILEALNTNFFLLDVMANGAILGFVDELPEGPEEGDAYIYSNDVYGGGDNNIYAWDGDVWVQIPPKPGFVMFNEDDGEFYWYNGTDWVIFPTTFGDVTGPDTAIDEGIARFDGTTGKFIKGSGVTLDDDDIMHDVEGIYSDFLATQFLDGAIVDDTSEGDDVDLGDLGAFVIRFTDPDLNSIANINPPNQESGYARVHILMNVSGQNTILRNNANIRTGTGDDLDVADDAAIIIAWDDTASQWAVIGGSGAGGGDLVLGTFAAPELIDSADGLDTMSDTRMSQIIYIAGNGAPTTIVAANQLKPHTEDGAFAMVVGTSDVNPVKLRTLNNVVLKADERDYNAGSASGFRYDLANAKWREVTWSE